jgi:DNA-binding beta-propeller fold protein YncE
LPIVTLDCIFVKKLLRFGIIFLLSIGLHAQTLKELEANRIQLPNGWNLTPAGDKLPLGDLPLNIAVSNNGNFVAVTNNGQSDQSIMIIDTRTEKRTDSVKIAVGWLGLSFSKDDKTLYASAGNGNRILCYTNTNGKLALTDSIILGKIWPEKISPTGLCVDDARKRLYAVTKENNSLYVINLENKKIIKQVSLPAEAYTCALSPADNNLYISIWGDEKVLIYNTRKDTSISSIHVGSNPNDLIFSYNGKYLFLSNANDNSVSVISTADNKVVETLDAAIYPNSLEGSTTNSVALSADDKTLYIANADNNCLAVFDVSKPGHSFPKGFIPTGWYPTCVRVVNHKIWVSNGKGFSSMANPDGPNPLRGKQQTNYKQGDKNKPRKVQYIGGLFTGTMSIIPEPDTKVLADYSQAVYHNTPYKGATKDSSLLALSSSPHIKYVFYVLKENRTYDQVLGDMPNGNGDTSLCLFPERITPNEHAIADEFVLLDNFYVDAEVSADGHNWSMAAYANDYVEKTWPTSYGGRGGNYDYSGNRKIALPKAGFIWDDCRKNNVSYRNYGEFRGDDDGKIELKDLANHTCSAYTGWNLSYHDVDREKVWEKDFDSLVAANAVPQFNIVYFPNDHTSGLAKGAYTPYALVADNDLALGRFMEHLSQSPIWKECVVFVTEDDAQNGADHVDAHRSIALVAGPFVKRHFTDHTMYSTSSMLHTMEVMLGLQPMSQYDAAAMPMWASFMPTFNTLPYVARNSNININDKNTAYNELMKKSNKFNFRKADGIPEEAFNEVLWKAIKGSAQMPAPRHCGFVVPNKSSEKDDD